MKASAFFLFRRQFVVYLPCTQHYLMVQHTEFIVLFKMLFDLNSYMNETESGIVSVIAMCVSFLIYLYYFFIYLRLYICRRRRRRNSKKKHCP